jgi:hypothetical protein
MTPEQLVEIKARAEAMPSKEWKSTAHNWIGTADDETIAYVSDHGNDRARSPKESRAIAVFIAHARADIPNLLLEIKRLQTLLEANDIEY